jgi:outer membrane protein
MSPIAMNSTALKSLIIIGAGLFCTSAALAQTKVATVDLQKVFEGYWKIKQADVQLKDQAADFDKQRNELVGGYQKANEEYKRLKESMNDPALADPERERRKTLAETKLRDIQEMEGQVSALDRTARNALDGQRRLRLDAIMRDIQEAVTIKAKAAGYTLVCDSSARSSDARSSLIILYAASESDLSDEILSQLNKGAPPEFVKPAGAKGP